MKSIHRSLLLLSLLSSPLLTATTVNANEDTSVVANVSQNKVNVNKAGVEQLSSLKGLGEKKAQAIVQYRDTYGPFKSIEELKNVKGIGVKFIEKNSAYLVL
ncbi:ComEA family DNA-binding protein [Thalassomonas sp. M1454]|uniref:ComEA family DNA-binding protein n=1 Tax=Thalassomonas sp. M1454 TaxID=2594477 RepID=UPI00117DF9BE|nr:helix-hairpin-helix domain-containing protein [Thalassomonas sp. M1454]TRX56637.1 helix-hairpin-helix domain-containing protein [Thalassomonas sp. M1454]